MYELADKAMCKRYRLACSNALKKVCSMLKGEGIIAQFTLVGSGAGNMVTRNGNGAFDLDYNLEIIKAPNQYWKDLRSLKDTIRCFLDKAAGMQCFSASKDSTSCLTALLYFKNEPTVAFSFDVAIISKNRIGNLCNLIHNKNAWGYGQDQYVWNEIPNSCDVTKKAKQIKQEGQWMAVRDQYIILKNLYLSRGQDKDHPSCTLYIEAVNNVYNQLFCFNVPQRQFYVKKIIL